MRLSVEPNDPGYSPDLCRYARIMLDGVLCGNVITADEDTGEILRYIAGSPVLETVRGRVQIVWPTMGENSYALHHKANCKLDRFSSRVCERGTKSCTIVHPT